MRNQVRYLLVAVCMIMGSLRGFSQAIPVPLTEQGIYDFLDEMIMDGVLVRQTAIRPYTRVQVADMLSQVAAVDSLLSRRQQQDLAFYLEEFALELDTIPDYTFYGLENKAQWRRVTGQPLGNENSKLSKADFNLSLVDPSFHLKTSDNKFKLAIRPILGMDIDANKKGFITHRYYGAEIRMDVVNHVAVWGSIRDHSWKGTDYLKSEYFPTAYDQIYGARLSKPQYLNNLQGVQYKEANYGGDFSDSRGGIAAYSWWGRIAVERECIRWGDAYHSSNILSGHNPAVPMVSLQLTPCSWFQFDYFHAWLVSNVLDSTSYYIENGTDKKYRPASKYMAANMFTFTPCKYVSFSFGNSIIYAERSVQAAYFIPVAFFKSLDHLLTKGLNTENQNSQVFASISLRPVDHLQLYGSFFVDEFKMARLKRSNAQKNPISYLVGFNWSGWPVRGLSLKGEFMRSYIACYTHSIDVLSYTSNGYNMGHYMGDNAQSIFAELAYRPIRGLTMRLSYTANTRYNVYDYMRGDIGKIIAYKPFDEVTWKNDIVSFNVGYELFQNCYAHLGIEYNNARSYVPTSDKKTGEWRGDYLNRFTPVFYQGKNLSMSCGLNFSF